MTWLTSSWCLTQLQLTVPVTSSSTTSRLFKDDLTCFAAVAAEVDDVGLMLQQQTLQVGDADRKLLLQIELVAVFSVAQGTADLSALHI